MNDVPLVNKNDINSINTSLIAIKKQLKLLNEAVGLIGTPNSPDLTPYVKKSDIVDTVQSGNMNPVTSNAVATSNAMPVNSVASGNMHSVTSNAVASALNDKVIVRRKTITPRKTITALNYAEVNVPISDLPISISGYELISANAVQSADDAFLYNLHISNNHFRLTIFNCAPQTSQTTQDIYLTAIFRKLDT